MSISNTRRDRLFLVFTFLAFVAENDEIYGGKMWTPLKLLGWYIDKLPIKLFPFELVCLYFLFTAPKKLKVGRARPAVTAVRASLFAVAGSILWGAINGGWFKACYTQINMWVFGCLFVLTASSVLTTVEHYQRLYRTIAYAAIYRAVMAIVFYLYIRNAPEIPPVMTSHQDSVLFVVGLVYLLVQALELRTKKVVRLAIVAAPIIIVAIQVNNRRIAWASLFASLMLVYFMLPKKAKAARIVNRWLMVLVPVAAIYVAIGWGRHEKIFKPLAAVASMGAGKVDASTKARDNENLGLMIMVQQRPILGTGFGHQWLEVDSTYTVHEDIFPMYHYLPHNNVLAMFAFTGCVGFAALWMVFPVSVFLLARTYRVSKDPRERSVAIVGIASVIVTLNQVWGDMGLICLTPVTIVCCGIAASSRLAITSSAWPSRAVAGPTETPARGPTLDGADTTSPGATKV